MNSCLFNAKTLQEILISISASLKTVLKLNCKRIKKHGKLQIKFVVNVGKKKKFKIFALRLLKDLNQRFNALLNVIKMNCANRATHTRKNYVEDAKNSKKTLKRN